ncbi:MAG: hypothetical protein K2Y22_11050 [Candidatus Obscuribacterales bacterium]|nr:hypothetical protein [Candidatus Obscuribacterales bacterium]
MKSHSALLLPAIAFALLGSIVLFGMSYWMQTSLTEQFVADSTELLKHPRYLKSVALAHIVFVVLAFVASFLLPRKLLTANSLIYIVVLYCCFSLTNLGIWFALTSARAISHTDPFYFYFPVSLELTPVVAGTLVLAMVCGFSAFWIRRKVEKV